MSEMKACQVCGMPTTADEYHPYAACLMFMGCKSSSVVRANLDAIRRPDPAPVGVRVPDAERWTPKYVLTALCDLAQDADQFNNGLASEIIELVAKYRSSVVLEPQAASLDRVSYVIGKLQKHAAKADARSRNRSGGHDDGVPSHTAMLVGETVELIRALKQRETLCAEKIDTAFVACCLSDYLECLREGIVRYGADNLDYLANQITALRLNPRPGAELLNNDPTSSKLVDEQPGAVVGEGIWINDGRRITKVYPKAAATDAHSVSPHPFGATGWNHSGGSLPETDIWVAAAYEGSPPFGAMLTALGDWIDLDGEDLSHMPDWWIYAPVAQDDPATLRTLTNTDKGVASE